MDSIMDHEAQAEQIRCDILRKMSPADKYKQMMGLSAFARQV